MASPDSSLASSPRPTPISTGLHVFFKLLISKTPEGQLLRIELSVLTTTVFLFLLLYLGSIRQRVRVGWLRKYLTKIIYILIPISITYIMGLMHNASTFHILYPLWACILLYGYGGVVTMTACDFSDNEGTLQYIWRTLPLFFWTGWLIALLAKAPNHTLYPGSLLQIILFLFLLSAIRNTTETLAAFYIASKSKGLPYEAEPIVCYMREAGKEGASANHLPRYPVWGNPMDTNNFTTTEEIWQLVGTRFLVDCAGKERLKDLCLSYAFFRLILRRFAGLPLYESFEPRTRHFIREGLLGNKDLDERVLDLERVERVFHIIEVELRFLFNFFYSKSHICTSSYDLFTVCTRLFLVIELAFFAFCGLPQIVSPQKKVFSIQFRGHSLEVGVTRLVIFIFFLLELWKVLNVWFSNRNMVRLLCKACRRMEATMDCGSISTWQIDLIWNVKDWFSTTHHFRFLFKPWQRHLGQYSFIESYYKVPKLSQFSCLGIFVKMPQIGQAGDSSVELSTEVKQAIVTSLLELLREAPNDQPIKFSRGRATITRYLLSEEISCACQLETDAHVILVWHIATGLCARYCHLEKNYPNFLVANQLSKYCAYLMTFSPELLPGHPFTTERLFEKAVKQAKRVELICFNLPEENADVGITMNDDVDPDEVVARGKVLAARLMNEAFTPNPDHGWRFLAEFWAELLLYLAPSDNVDIHGEYLAKGGEFITHLWALLTHAGVVSRSINCPLM